MCSRVAPQDARALPIRGPFGYAQGASLSLPPPSSDQSPRATLPPAPEDPALVNASAARDTWYSGVFGWCGSSGAGGMAVVWLAQDERLGLGERQNFDNIAVSFSQLRAR